MSAQQKRYLFLGLALLVGLLLAWQFINSNQHKGLVKIRVSVLPSDSRLTVDTKPVKPGNVYLSAGSHKFVASRVDFEDDTKTIDTSDIAKNQVIYMLPVANSTSAKNYLLRRPDVQKQRESAGGSESERIRNLLVKKYPVIVKLPQETLHYKIDYSIDSNQNFSLSITTYAIINGPGDYTNYIQQTKDYRQEALDFLQKNNVAPNTFSITYLPIL